MRLSRLACGLPVFTFALLVAACASDDASQKLSDEAVCMKHFENDPVERDRCRLDPELRRGTPPDVRPQDLPLRTGQISD